jgi:hypothetical protein
MHFRAAVSTNLRHAVKRRVTATVGSLSAAVLLAVGLGACGSSGSGEVLAKVGGSPVTQSAVSHWMGSLAGGDYWEVSHGHPLPVGLVSDPPDFARCVARLRAAVAANPHGGSASSSVLMKKCREINVALRIQAEGWLVDADWLTSVYGAEGVVAREPEVRKLFKQLSEREYPTQAALHQYLAQRDSSLADLLFVVKLDVLRANAVRKATAGGKSVDAEIAAAERRWTAKTICNRGFVVEHCSQYDGTQTYPGQSPAILMEQVATLTTGLCVNEAACGKE